MTLVWATLGAPERQVKVWRTNWETRAGSEPLLSVNWTKTCKARQRGIHFTFQEAPGHEDPGYFFHFSSLALVTIEMGRTRSPAVTFQQLVLSEMKSICCVQKSVMPKNFPALCIPPWGTSWLFLEEAWWGSAAQLSTWSTGGLNLPSA